MEITDRKRTEMHDVLVDVVGEERREAVDTHMAMLPPVGWADAATKRDLDTPAGAGIALVGA